MPRTKLVIEYQKRMLELFNKVNSKEFYSIVESQIAFYYSKNPAANIEEIRNAVHQILPPQFQHYADELYGKYNKIIETVNELYTGMGVDVQRDFSKIKNIEKATRDYLGKFEPVVEKKLVKTIRQGLFDKLSVKEFSKEISKAGDAVSAYSDTIARTKIMQYGRVSKIEKARIGGVLYYDYVGLIRDTTRDFCLNMLTLAQGGKRWTLDELNALDNGPKQLKPVSEYCGGWNCHHDAEPDPFYEG